MMGETTERRQGVAGNGTMGLFVSLYLILLAFFILLEITSERANDRVGEAVESVADTFKGERPGDAGAPSVAENGLIPDAADAGLRTLADRFRQDLQLEGRYNAAGGGQLVFTFDQRLLFGDGAFTLRTTQLPLLGAVANVAAGAPAGARYEVIMLFGRGGEAPGGGDLIALRRAASLKAALETSGAPSASLVAGIDEKISGNLTLAFRLVRGEAARVRLVPWGEVRP